MARRSGRSGRAAPADPFQESDGDEDFAAPPKKARPAGKRVPLGEKLFQRDLEVTLALSLNEYLGNKDKIQKKDDRTEPKAAVEDFKQETVLCTPETDNDEDLCANQENSQPPLEIELGSLESVGKPLKTSSPSVLKKPSWIPPDNVAQLDQKPKAVVRVPHSFESGSSGNLGYFGEEKIGASGSKTSPLGRTVRSPVHGLRLGLSRLAKVKPLHPPCAGT